MEAFEYTRLENPRREIRVLELQPGTWLAPLQASLHVYGRDQVPPYEAISYTWGPTTPVKSLFVDSKTLDIRQSCAIALQQVRYRSTVRRIWVDSVCIDQANLEEKSHQVQMMDQVYKNALGVLVSLGSPGDDSEYLLNFSKTLTRIIDCVQLHVENDALRIWEAWQSRSQHFVPGPNVANNAIYAWLANINDAYLTKVTQAFVAFSERPYWSRVWIRLELHFAPEVAFFCGKDTFLEKHIRNFQDFIFKPWPKLNNERRDSSMGQRLENAFSRTGEPPRQRCETDTFMLRTALGHLGTRESYGHKPNFNLDELLVLGCTDPRDRIFAYLPLMAPTVRSALPVDYGKTRLALMLEALQLQLDPYTMLCTSFLVIDQLLRALEVPCEHESREVFELLQLRRHSLCSSPVADAENPFCCCGSNSHTKRLLLSTSSYCHIAEGLRNELGANVIAETEVPGSRSSPPTPLRYDPVAARSASSQVVRNVATSSSYRGAIALVPWNTRPGDVLVTLHCKIFEDHEQCVVMRKDVFGVYEIIGQAIRGTGWHLQESPPLYLHIDPQDAVSFLVRASTCSHSVPDTATPELRLEPLRCLMESFTSSKFSSYACEENVEGMTMDTVCGECGRFIADCPVKPVNFEHQLRFGVAQRLVQFRRSRIARLSSQSAT